jgi:VanZ family protein
MRATIHGLRVAVIALVGYWVLLFIATHIPPNALLKRVHESDKLLHCGAFACFAFLLAWAIPTNPTRMIQNVLVAALVGTIYAGLDELLQIPVGRSADIKDFVADSLGILIGLSIYSFSRYFVMKKGWRLLHAPSKP